MKYVLYSCGVQPINKHFLQMERHILDNDVIGCVQRKIVMWDENGYGQWFWSEDDINRIHKDGKKLLNLSNAKRSLLEQIKAVQYYWKIAKDLLNLVKNDFDKKELAKLYRNYSYALRRVYAHFMTSTGQVTYAVESRLLGLLKEKFPNEADKYYEVLTTPNKPDLLFDEINKWSGLIKNPTKSRLLAHTKKYSIMLPNVFSEHDALDWSNKRLENKSYQEIKKEINEYKIRKIKLRKNQQEILGKFSSKEVEILSWIIQESAITRLLIKSCWNGESYHLLPFFKIIAEIAKCSVHDIYFFYTWKEVYQVLNNNINLPKRELERRKQYCLLYFDKPNITIYSGMKALKMKKRLLDPSIPNRKTKSFRGTIANKGIVAGKVVLLKEENPNEIHKIAKRLTADSILVTGMTNPSITIFMNKLSGIITDEGGSACHAAIISREFGVPCLVGCKIGTLVLKDNDNILLNANKGIVKKISKIEFKRYMSHKKEKEKIVKRSYITPVESKKQILWISEISEDDLYSVGGKAANLGKLFGKYTIPIGFCVTNSVYQEFIKQNNIIAEIKRLDSIDKNDAKSLETQANKIKNQIINRQINSDIKEKILSEFKKLNSGQAAVRSSATAEDLLEASFAGQQDTYLNINRKDLIKSIKKCWASLFNFRAIYYRSSNDIEHSGVSISVLIQQMVNTKYAGVMFTIDPVNKKYSLIEVVEGLGEQLVSGAVTPNSYFLDRKRHSIERKDEHFFVDSKIIKKISRIGIKIEKHFNFPQDIEWAIDYNDNIFILQSRPITSLS